MCQSHRANAHLQCSSCVHHALALNLQQNVCTTSKFHAAVLIDKLGIVNGSFRMGYWAGIKQSVA